MQSSAQEAASSKSLSSMTKAVEEFEPLLDSKQAAKLVGNIHVKTLQRYARRGSVPSYRIAGHWFFRASELDAWVRSQINSSCRPCR
jgi:excisionase family DNA binding protein